MVKEAEQQSGGDEEEEEEGEDEGEGEGGGEGEVGGKGEDEGQNHEPRGKYSKRKIVDNSWRYEEPEEDPYLKGLSSPPFLFFSFSFHLFLCVLLFFHSLQCPGTSPPLVISAECCGSGGGRPRTGLRAHDR